MKTRKYFIAIMAIFLVVLNVCIFLITNLYKKEALQNPSWWISYALLMSPLVIIILVRFLNKDNDRKLSAFLPLVFPISALVFILGLVFIFIAHKLTMIIPLMFLIIFLALAAIAVVFGLMHKENEKNVPYKEVEIMNMQSLRNYLQELSNHGNQNISTRSLELYDLALKDPKPELSEEELKKLEKRIFEITFYMKRDLKENKLNNFFNHTDNMESLLRQRGNL